MSWYSIVKKPTSFLLSLRRVGDVSIVGALWGVHNWGTLRVRLYVCRRFDDDDDDDDNHCHQWPSAWVGLGLLYFVLPVYVPELLSSSFSLWYLFACCQVIPLATLLTRFSTIACERGEVVSLTPTAYEEDQATVFMYPEDRVARLYPQSPDSSDTSGLPLSVST